MRYYSIKKESSSFPSDQPAASISVDIREVLFGDDPLEKVASYARDLPGDNPWALFNTASQRLAAGDTPGAIAALKKILQMKGLEARIYLQAWHSLRALGQMPTQSRAREIQGIIVEVALERGLDIIAAFVDGSVRYFNYSGAAVVWDEKDEEIDRIVTELLTAGQGIVDISEPWDGPRPEAPSVGMVRLNLLTFGGLHFGQGTFSVVAQDGLGGLALRGAFDLMQTLVAKVKARNAGG
jgi:hypothetical protein